MLFGQLNAKHPSYDAETWSRYAALYEGGRRFRENVGAFLEQHPQEPPDVYAQRKRAAKYKSYVGPIVDFFAAQLMAAALTIRALNDVGGDTVEPDPFYARFKEDVDGVGADLVDFARATFRTCLQKQAAWWLATLPANQNQPPGSRAEWEERRLGEVRVCALEPEAVLDWELDDAGELLWACTYECTSPRASILASRSLKKHVWRVYDRERCLTFEKLHDEQKDGPLKAEDEIPLVSNDQHGFPRVPLIRVEVPVGLWLLNRVADAQTEHFALSAGLGWAIRRSCYAMPVFMMDGEDNPKVMGAGYFLKLGQNDKMAWAAPPAQPFEVIAAEKKSEKDEIYRVAQQMAQGVDNNAAAIGRSGESKLADSSSTEVCLKAYGAVMREGVEKLFDLVAAGRKDPIKFSVSGLDKFNLADAGITVENSTKAKALDVPSSTFKEEMLMAAAEAMLPGLDQDKKEAIRKEITAGVAKQEKEAEEAKKKLLEAPPPSSDQDDKPPPPKPGTSQPPAPPTN
ncbi:MAG: hypothetical protein HOW73_47630 [Polyangiaceae bacterium]|nr:hypothetical protein [Polyangiaceae bacterium]